MIARTVPASLLLSTRERYAVTLGLILALVCPLAGFAFAGSRLGGDTSLAAIAVSVTVIVLSSASMPLASDIAQRAVLRGPLVRFALHLTLASTHVLALLVTLVAVLALSGVDVDPAGIGVTYVQTAQSGFLCYAATAGVIRAVQWYRSASLAETERRALETAEIEKARDLIDRTLRPGMVSEALRGIRAMLPGRQAEAEQAVTRLARHGRMAVAATNRRTADRSGAAPDPGPPLVPLVRYSGSVYPWVAALAGVNTLLNLYGTTLSSAWLATWTDVASAPLWLLAALPLIRIAERIAALRGWIAAPALLATAWLAGTAVALAALGVLSAAGTVVSIPRSDGTPLDVLPMAARQNVLIACAIAGVSFAFAHGSRLLGAQASVGRMRQALASAELRNLEARIQPHFLFNALVSLLALIRLDPGRAAGMCDLLSDLFARSVAASGVHEWPLREEIALTTGYLAVQHIRFGERLVARTAVDPGLHDRLVPRLLLQPLVENAIKHGVARREEPTHVTIAATDRHGALHLEVANDADSAATHHPPSAGGGLTFVQSRVAAAGGTVDYDACPAGTFSVRCVLP